MEIIADYTGGLEYDVSFDRSGNPLIKGTSFPLPFYADNDAEFIEYHSPTLKGLRAADARDALYRIQSLKRPIRPSDKPAPALIEPSKPLTLREQAYALQENPLEPVPRGNETSSQAYRRAAAERADQVSRLLDKERQQLNAESWQNIPPDQRALNNHAQIARNLWAEKQAQQFARQNGGHVLGSDGRAVKN